MRHVARVKRRREAARRVCKQHLEQVVSGQGDPYIHYLSLYKLWCGINAAVPELRPMFRIPDACPESRISMTEELKAQIISLARDILPKFYS
jgi:hypothetical protein